MEADIERALFAHVLDLGGPIVWQNLSSAPNGAYLRISLSFARPDRLTLDALHRLSGWLQIDVMTPEGQGTNMARVQQVIDHFPADLVLSHDSARLRITERATVGPLIKDVPHWQQPVTVRFSAPD